MESLMTYLVFEQDQYAAHIWTREADAFPSAPTVIRGRDKILRIEGLNLILPLAAVYAGTALDCAVRSVRRGAAGHLAAPHLAPPPAQCGHLRL